VKIPNGLVVPLLSAVRLPAMVVGHHRIGAQRERARERLDGGIAVSPIERLLACLKQVDVIAIPVGVLNEQHAGRDDQDETEEREGALHDGYSTEFGTEPVGTTGV
jgi:hypothetical protein